METSNPRPSRVTRAGRTRIGVRAFLAPVALSLTAGIASAQIPQSSITIELVTVASGLTAPLGVTHAGDGSGRLFIVEQSGQIKILQGGVVLPTPFLDISAKLPVLNAFFDERGLLGLAFHPDYENNGRFFVRYSAPRAGLSGEPCFGTTRGCHKEILAEYSVSAGDPNVADITSESILFSVDEPEFNHNAGDVAFGPDGLLYFPLGDGGGANDGLSNVPPSHGPFGNGQNIDTALGAMLRIDVDGGTPYAIPFDNPFVGVAGLDEIYAYGLRNPYKFCFDDGPGGNDDLILADVGQDLFEEINVVQNGGNYGWVVREGFNCFDPSNPAVPPAACPTVGALGEPLLPPIAEYSHDDGTTAIVGGFVYRGTQSPSLVGKYICGDFSAGFLTPAGRLFVLENPWPGFFRVEEFVIGDPAQPYGLFLKGFGEGEDGEVYVCGAVALAPFGTTGVVHRIQELAECFLVIGPAPGSASFQPGAHAFTTQVKVVKESYVVLLDQIPEFVIAEAGYTVSRPTGKKKLRRLPGRTLTAQVLMWNPAVFPNQPEQFTGGVRVDIDALGNVKTSNYGAGTGMQIQVELDTNAQGQEVIRFPFTIPGM